MTSASQGAWARKNPGDHAQLSGIWTTHSTMAVLRGYALPEEEIVHVARMLAAMINGFLALESSGGFGHRYPDPEVSWRRTLTALDTVIRSWPTTQDPTAPTPMRPREEPPT